MKKNRWIFRAAVLFVISGVLAGTFSAAADAGSSGDPLVTLSYLNETYLPNLLAKVDAKITDRNAALINQLGGGVSSGGGGTVSTFTVVTLSKGQTLKGTIGCEMMLRVGTASCVATSSPGLIDETTGGNLAGGGALVQNHLYMQTVENRGVKATSTTVKVLVRGGYSIA